MYISAIFLPERARVYLDRKTARTSGLGAWRTPEFSIEMDLREIPAILPRTWSGRKGTPSYDALARRGGLYSLNVFVGEGTVRMRGMGSRGGKRVARIARQRGVTGFELTLAPSREDSKRYAIEAVGEIDRHTALEVLRTCSLGAAVFPAYSLARREQDGAGGASVAARIALVRLAPRQVLSMFEAIRGRDAGVRKLYSNLEEGNFALMGDRARGSVIRAYTPDGAARGEGIVIELPHKRADGTEAVFNVSIKEGMSGEGKPGEVRADYVIRRGRRVEAYAVRDGGVSLAPARG